MLENKTLNVNEIIKIEQLPKIYYQLEKVGEYIDNELKDIDKLECTEENKKEVKEKRTIINNTLTNFENARKEVKNKILEGYNLFEDKYSTEVKKRLESASKQLTEQINKIENEQKEIKRNKMIEFFNQYKEYYCLNDIVEFEDLKLNITLSASELSLKNQIQTKLNSIAEDLVAISSEPKRDEILLEYKENGFNYSQAINTVNSRYVKIHEMSKKNDELASYRNETQIIETRVNEIITPVEVKEEETNNSVENIEICFKIKTTKELYEMYLKEPLKELRNLMKEKGIDYE